MPDADPVGEGRSASHGQVRMRGERTKVRLYVSAELDRGCTVGLTPTQAHYLKHVLRLEAGDSLSLFNGRDGEWTALIDGLGKGWGSLSVQERRRGQEAEPDLWLVFAPIKRTRIDFLAQKATELGVSALWPVFTRHTVVSRVNTERLRANAVEAAEQSGRLTVPTVFEPATLDEVLARWPAERRLALCDNSGGGAPIGRCPGPGLGGTVGAPGRARGRDRRIGA